MGLITVLRADPLYRSVGRTDFSKKLQGNYVTVARALDKDY